MQTARIITQADTKRARSFEAACLAYVSIHAEGSGNGNTLRPVWAAFAAPEQQLRAFMANVRLGRSMELLNTYNHRSSSKLEFLKTGGFSQLWQTGPEGAIATVVNNDLFQLDPGMVDPNTIRFANLLPVAWLDSQELADTTRASASILERTRKVVDARFVKQATVFTAYLERRTRCPLPNDSVFHTNLYYACLHAGLASVSENTYDLPVSHYRGGRSIEDVRTSELGFGPVVYCRTSHSIFEELLAEETTRYYSPSMEKYRGAA